MYSSLFIFLALDTAICIPTFENIPLRRKLWQILFEYSRTQLSAYIWPWACASEWWIHSARYINTCVHMCVCENIWCSSTSCLLDRELPSAAATTRNIATYAANNECVWRRHHYNNKINTTNTHTFIRIYYIGNNTRLVQQLLLATKRCLEYSW